MTIVALIADKGNLLAAVEFYKTKYIDSKSGRYRCIAGSDRQTFQDFIGNIAKEIESLSNAILSGYSFSPYLRRVIITEDGKKRQVYQATVRDTIVLKSMSKVVSAHFDYALASQCFSCRTGRNSPKIFDALQKVVRLTRSPLCWVLQEDIASYFDSIDLSLLMDQLAILFAGDEKLLALFRSYLFTPHSKNGQLFFSEKGLPTGTSPSNFLANLYLAPLDYTMTHLNVCYLRYCDDLLVFVRTEKEGINSKTIIENSLANLSLKTKPSKSQLVAPGSPFTFLGYEFSSGTPRIGIKAIRRFKNRIRHATRRKLYNHIQRDRTILVSRVIQATNAHIAATGSGSFVFYFSRCNVVDQFGELDEWVRDRVRAVLGKSWRHGLRKKFPHTWLESRGLKSLVREYYACRRFSRDSNPTELL